MITLTYEQEFAMAVAQWVRAFAPQAESCVFESQTQQTEVVRTGSDSSTTQRSKIRVGVMSPQR